jgi:hypothetical protein
MKTRFIILLTFFTSLLGGNEVFSQNVPSGDRIIKCLGQEVISNDVLDMILVFEMKDDFVPDVKAGGGLTFYSPGGKVQRIGFQNNKDYGTYAGQLPFGLSFENSGDDILKLFPAASVNEDYLNFNVDNYSIAVKFTSPKMKKIEFISVY